MEPTDKYHPEVKVTDRALGIIEGWGIPFGGPINGGDLDGEFFDAKTDFRFDLFPDGRPILYDHGTDRKLGSEVLGRQTEHRVVDDIGVWVKGQLNMAHRYAEAVMELIDAKALGFSSLAMRHLISKESNGHIAVWPWIEQTLTVHPANPSATIESAKAFAHMKTLGLAVPTSMRQKSKKAITLPDGMSIDDAQQTIRAAIRDEYPALFGDDDYLWINEMYDATVIVSVDDRYYEIAYTLGTDGAVSLTGQPKEVRRKTDWEAIPKNGKGRFTFSQHLEQAGEALEALSEFGIRAKSLAALRAKDGREFAYREEIGAFSESLKVLGLGFDELMAATAPAPVVDGASLLALHERTKRDMRQRGLEA